MQTKHPTEQWSYRTADAPGTNLRFVIETHAATWDPYALQDGEGTRGDWVCHERGYRRIAMTTDGGREAERDAALLAASPRLLAACMEAESALRYASSLAKAAGDHCVEIRAHEAARLQQLLYEAIEAARAASQR